MATSGAGEPTAPGGGGLGKSGDAPETRAPRQSADQRGRGAPPTPQGLSRGADAFLPLLFLRDVLAPAAPAGTDGAQAPQAGGPLGLLAPKADVAGDASPGSDGASANGAASSGDGTAAPASGGSGSSADRTIEQALIAAGFNDCLQLLRAAGAEERITDAGTVATVLCPTDRVGAAVGEGVEDSGTGARGGPPGTQMRRAGSGAASRRGSTYIAGGSGGAAAPCGR
jgi:hypothetical protein